MTMTPYNTDLTRALKWLHNNAPNLQSIITQKADWYAKYNEGFWTNWEANVFDIRTCNAFGLVVWCIILGLPISIFNFEPITNAFAFGAQRGNFLDGGGHELPLVFVGSPVIYSNGVPVPSGNYSINLTTGQITFTAAPALNAVLSWTGTVVGENGQDLIVTQPRKFGTGDGTTTSFSLLPSDAANYNEVGFNFYGGGSQSVALLSEIRQACQLRYVALVSNGRQQWINQMLQYIFNAGQPWDFPGKKYFYLHDQTGAIQNVTNAVLYRSDWQGMQKLYQTSRTNYVWPTNQIATSNNWAATSATIANIAGPDGTANGAATITPTTSGTAGTVHPTNAATGLPLNNTFTFSQYIKAGTALHSKFAVLDSTLATTLGSVTVAWASGVPSVSATGGSGLIAGTAQVVAAGVAGWYRVSFAFNNGTQSSLNNVTTADADLGTGTVTIAYPQGELGLTPTSFIKTTSAAATVASDYTLNVSTGAVVMTTAPLNAAVLSWTGTWRWATATTPQSFGTGNGSATSFTLSEPPGAVAPITRQYYMEYRVGANMNLSSQFLNLLNNSGYGIMPQCAGIAYTVVQES